MRIARAVGVKLWLWGMKKAPGEEGFGIRFRRN
jgi:hypothetical protein